MGKTIGKFTEEMLTKAQRDASSITEIVLIPAIKEFVDRMDMADYDMTVVLSLLAHLLARYQVETLIALAGNERDRSLMLLDTQYEGMRTHIVEASDPSERTADD